MLSHQTEAINFALLVISAHFEQTKYIVIISWFLI